MTTDRNLNKSGRPETVVNQNQSKLTWSTSNNAVSQLELETKTRATEKRATDAKRKPIQD